MVDQCIETLNLYAENIGENQIICDNGDNSSVPISNYWCNPESHKNQSNFSTLEDVQNNSVENLQSSISVLKNSFSSPNFQTKQISKASSEMENEEVDPLLASLNQLQKSVELTLNNSEKVLKQKNEEKERAYIAQILEGDNSLDERFDSLSDNENDLKENVNEANLINRLDKMKELFGVEENGEIPKEKSKLPNYRLNHSNCRVRKPTIWKHEKVIQQYRFAMLSSEMSFSRQVLNKRLFLELFGDDSDEEHESEYRLHEKYRASCTERISSWVVKYLMPYYHDKRIIGRNIFKSLGHHISDVIVGKIQYPDEWTVKYFVSKFFPTKKKYACDADIFTFEFQ